MTPFLKIATDLVETCLKDSPVRSAVRMRLAGEIVVKLREQYKAGMLRAAEVCETTPVFADMQMTARCATKLDCAFNIRALVVAESVAGFMSDAPRPE